MPCFLLVMGKPGLCRGPSSYRNNAGWHDPADIGRSLSGSGYQHGGRDELTRRVEVKMFEENRAHQVVTLLDNDELLPW